MTASLRIEIFPSDLRATIHFYTFVLGFTLVRHEPNVVVISSDHEDNSIDKGYAHLVSGSVHIGADGSHPVDSLAVRKEYRHPPTAVELVLEVDDLDDVRERVKRQNWPVRSDEDIKHQPWGLRDFRVEDPDGYYIRISEKGQRGDGTGF